MAPLGLRHRVTPLFLLAAWVVFAASSAAYAQDAPADAAPASEPAKVDFHRHVRPLLESRCYQCHGEMKQKGHLRLDSRDAAIKGGDSGIAIVGTPAAQSVLLARITSDDPNEVMPPPDAGDPLTESQVALLRRWVEQGAEWPSEDDTEPGTAVPLWALSIMEAAAERVGPYTDYLVLWAGVFIAIEVARRVARRIARRSEAPGRVARHVAGWGAAVHLGVIAVIVIAALYRENGRLSRELAEVRSAPPRAVLNESSVFGYPPRPFHPGHPPRLAGPYYRGNCERSDKLFNGGHYLTARFELALVDGDGKPVQVGDAVTDRPLFLQLDLLRAPHTPDALFSPAMVERDCLSAQVLKDASGEAADAPAPFKPIDPSRHWRAVYELPRLTGPGGKLDAVVYLYHGADRDGDRIVKGERHYGIVAELEADDRGRLAEGSQVWMNALFWTGAVQAPVDPTKLPFTEWFDDEPIPPIVGENTKDPKLLGVEDHIDPATGKPRQK